jgi:pyruvate dehydrogenase E2 component (dihydrolipoamide acetyltransferase)
VKATGPRGRVLLDDLLKNVTGKTVPQHTEGMVVRPSPSYKGELEERVPLRGLRKAIAKQMVLSKYTAPHFTYVDEVDVTKLVRLREHAKELGEKKGVKVTFLPFIVKAVIAALKEFPHLNASLDEEAQEVVVKHYFNIGIAVATKDGLIVPVVKDADHLTIFGLARAIAEKSKAALEGHSKLEDLKGGTFTITNIGGIGGLFATPIINYPEVAILGINKIQRRPVFRNGKIAVRDMTYISLSLDHRVVDGAIAAQFTNVLMRYLESPELLFLDEM